MSKKLLLVALSLVLPLMISAQSTCTFTTSTVLKRGSTHPDVLIMQRILNLDPATRIAKTGSGSPGKENSYFGTLTYNALLKFQSKYAVTVEKGYLGTVTRAKLTQVCTATPVVIKPSNSTLPTISSVTNATTLTLTASNGTWHNNPTSYTYRWLRNGTGITNAIYSTYTTKSSDVGSNISVRVTATNKAGSASATSLPKTIANPVITPTPTPTSTPVIYSITVSKVGSGTVTSSGGSINCGTSCTTTVSTPITTTLTATPATGYTFTGWSGGTCSGTSPSCAFLIDGAETVVATFTQTVVTPTPTPTGNECSNWQTAHPTWIWCDDFETDKTSSYFESSNNFVRTSGAGKDASYGMKSTFSAGSNDGGSLKLAFGATPAGFTKPSGVDTTTKYRDIYYRAYLKTPIGWNVGTSANQSKFARAISLSSSDWSQAMVSHLWSDGITNTYLLMDPVSCVSGSTANCVGYNDFSHMQWLGNKKGITPLFSSSNNGSWQCIESHVKLNDAGVANGVEEFWINGNLEARTTNLNYVGSYSAYGINAIFFENYINNGSPVTQSRYWDNIVVSTTPIGCNGPTSPTVDTTSPTTPTGVTATAVSSSQINLSWTASTDNLGVVAYKILRGGIQIATTTTTSYQNMGLTASTAYTYTVQAFDMAGNVSGQSVGVPATTLSLTTYSLTVSKVGSGTVTSSGGSINCGTSCTTTVSTPITTTLTATPATGYTFTGWSGGTCSGTSPSCAFLIDGAETVVATFTASVSQPTSSVTLDDFSGSRLNSGLGADIISLYAGEDPGQSLSISNGLLSVTGSPTNGIYWQFQPYPYTGSLGFTKGWIESGVWNQDANRLKFSFMCDANMSKTSSGYGNVQFGTYVKKDDGNGTIQGAHYYHHIDPNIYSGKWINVDINRTPQHQVGMAADTNWSEDPIWNSGTGVHYFDGLTRFYFDTQGAGFSGVNCKFTPIKFTNVSGEPDQQISSVTYQYTGSRYEVTWSGQKNSSVVYDVAYSPSSMKVSGFSSGTNGGTISATGNTYTNVIWTSPSIAQNTNGMYVAIRPQGQSSFTEVYVPYVAASTPTTYSLSLTTTSGAGYITGTGITTCTSSCTSNLASGASVTLTAVATTGYTFSGWSGACTGSSTTCTVNMTSAKSVGATFSQTVVTPPTGTTPTISSVSGTVQTGQTLTITGSSMVQENRTGWDPFFTTRTNASGFEGSSLLTDYGNSKPCHSYDTTMKLMGSKSLKISDSGSSSVTDHGGCEFDFVPEISAGTGPTDAYFRVYSRWNNNEWPNEIIKYWWLGGSPKAAFLNLTANGGAAPTQLGFTQTDYSGGTQRNFNLPDGALQNNKWYLFELHVQKHVAPGTYQYEAWVDNKLVFSTTSTSGVSPNSAGWGFASNVNYWSTSPAFVSEQWQDGFTIASSRVGPASLIEISNSSTYGVGTTVYQSPIYLSDGSVQVTANLTGLGSGPYYLWVTNSGKARSQPYLLGSGTPTTYSLSLTTTSGAGYITGTGITTCTSSCTSNLASGASVTLTAVATTGYTFSGWSGACTGSSTTCTVNMTSAKSVGATFTQVVATTPTVGDSGNQLYVSPTGNDAVTRANNSITNPWRTITHALYNLQAGDTLNIRSGTYVPAYPIVLHSDYRSRTDRTRGGDPNEIMNAQTGTAASPVVVRVYPGDTKGSVVIDALGKTTLINLDNKSYWTFDGLKIINTSRAFWVGEDVTSTNNTFQNLEIVMTTGGDNYGAITLNGYTTEYGNIHNNKITGPGLGVHQNTAGIWATVAENVTITNNEVSNAPIGIYYKHSNVGSPTNTNIRIANNYIYNTSRNSIQLNARYAVVENNVIGMNSSPVLFAEANGKPGGDYNTFTHNTVFSGGLSLPYETQDWRDSNNNVIPDPSPGSIGNIIKDNIVFGTVSIHPYQTNPHGTVMDYNLYGGTITSYGNPNATLAQWKTIYGQDMHSTSVLPTFVGGATPTSITGFTLNTNSVGNGIGSNGSNMGANPVTVGPR